MRLFLEKNGAICRWKVEFSMEVPPVLGMNWRCIGSYRSISRWCFNVKDDDDDSWKGEKAPMIVRIKSAGRIQHGDVGWSITSTSSLHLDIDCCESFEASLLSFTGLTVSHRGTETSHKSFKRLILMRNENWKDVI